MLRMQAMRKHAKTEQEQADIYKEIGILYLRQDNLNAVRTYPSSKEYRSNFVSDVQNLGWLGT